MKSNEEVNKAIDAVLLEHAPLNAKGRVTVRELILDAIEGAGFDIVGNERAEPLLLQIAGVPIKHLSDLRSMYDQTIADPNADNDYLRGYNNGIRLAHATIFAGEPNFIEPVRLTDYQRPAYCSEDGTRYTRLSALDEDDEDIQSLVDRDRE